MHSCSIDVEGDDCKRRKVEAVLATGGERDRRTTSIFAPRAACAVRLRRAGGQLERPRDVDRDRLRLVARIPQRQDPATRGPGGVTVYLELARVAAEPMRIAQDVGILARPLRRFG